MIDRILFKKGISFFYYISKLKKLIRTKTIGKNSFKTIYKNL